MSYLCQKIVFPVENYKTTGGLVVSLDLPFEVRAEITKEQATQWIAVDYECGCTAWSYDPHGLKNALIIEIIKNIEVALSPDLDVTPPPPYVQKRREALLRLIRINTPSNPPPPPEAAAL